MISDSDLPLGGAASPPEDDLVALRVRLEAINLHGMAEAASALLGDSPGDVAFVLASWHIRSYGELPRLTSPCWKTLVPLGLSLPPGPAPRVLDGLLAGVHAEGRVLLDALQECRDRADAVPPQGPLPLAGDHLVAELWRRALAAALADFWALVSAIYAHARPAVLAGDYADSCRVIGIERTSLHAVMERIGLLAHRAVGVEPPSVVAVPEPDVPPLLLTEEPVTEVTWEPPAEVGNPPRPVSAEDLLDHEWAPIVFLIVSTWIAIAILLIVLRP
ncbi:MAG: hypothetical protein ACRDZO_22640 [Egibacteraceae bacterium]